MDWPEREKLLPLYEACNVPSETFDSEEIRRRWPALAPTNDMKGLFDPMGGYCEPDASLAVLSSAPWSEDFVDRFKRLRCDDPYFLDPSQWGLP